MKKAILSFAFLFPFAGVVQAQSVIAGTHYSFYQDISPDSLLNYTVSPYTHEVYALDVSGTAGSDLELIAHGAVSSGGSGAYISVSSTNPDVYILRGRVDSVFVPATSGWFVTNVAKPLNAGETINTAGAVWENNTLYLTDHSGSGGGNKDVNDFIGGEHYLGIKYEQGATDQYGWIRVECPTEDSCYVKDYSMATSSVSVEETDPGVISVYPNPVEGDLFIDGLPENCAVTITDPRGADAGIGFVRTDADRMKLDGSALAKGCYLVQVITGETVITRRIIKLN